MVCRRMFRRPPIRWRLKPMAVMRARRSGVRRRVDATRLRPAPRRVRRVRMRRRVALRRAGVLARPRRAVMQYRLSRCCARGPRRHRRDKCRCRRNHLKRTRRHGCRQSRSRRLGGCASLGRAPLRRVRRVRPVRRLAMGRRRLDVARLVNNGRRDLWGAARVWLRVLPLRRVRRGRQLKRLKLRRTRQRRREQCPAAQALMRP
jgi:hypothetical protein